MGLAPRREPHSVHDVDESRVVADLRKKSFVEDYIEIGIACSIGALER